MVFYKCPQEDSEKQKTAPPLEQSAKTNQQQGPSEAQSFTERLPQMSNMILDFGKNKGHQISECDTKYLKWLVSYEKVLALRNRWSSRDARFELERRARAAQVDAMIAEEVAAPKQTYRIISLSSKKERRDLLAEIEAKRDSRFAMLGEINEIKARKRSEDLGLRGNFGNRGFQLMR